MIAATGKRLARYARNFTSIPMNCRVTTCARCNGWTRPWECQQVRNLPAQCLRHPRRLWLEMACKPFSRMLDCSFVCQEHKKVLKQTRNNHSVVWPRLNVVLY